VALVSPTQATIIHTLQSIDEKILDKIVSWVWTEFPHQKDRLVESFGESRVDKQSRLPVRVVGLKQRSSQVL